MMGLVDQGLDIDERVMNAFMIESCCNATVVLWCESNWELGVAHISCPSSLSLHLQHLQHLTVT